MGGLLTIRRFGEVGVRALRTALMEPSYLACYVVVLLVARVAGMLESTGTYGFTRFAFL